LCDSRGHYAWCSQRRIDVAEFCPQINTAFVLRLYARRPEASDNECVQDYLEYFNWRLACDAASAAGQPFHDSEPVAVGGDLHFQQHFTGAPTAKLRSLPDLRDYARDLLPVIDPATSLDDLRRPYLQRKRSAVRKQLCAALLQAGYRSTPISRFFCVSVSYVSKIATEIRYAR
jgi:hypothetical protein